MAVLSPAQAFRRAYQCYHAGRIDQTVELCLAILKAEPGYPYAAFLLALIADREGREVEAERLLADAVDRCACSITLESPPPDAPRHRKNPNPSLHAALGGTEKTDVYNRLLRSFDAFLPGLRAISAESRGGSAPHWRNSWIPSFDGVALYCLTALKQPRRYIEVGSGISTRFVRQAIRDRGLSTLIVSIDPEPRAEIDLLCDEVIRSPLEQTDLGVFTGLAAGDLVFVDSSHRCFMGSDVTVFFTEVLPSLGRGVTVGLHDIFLPFDYPEEWVPRYYTEQYLLACCLLGGGMPFRVLLPMHFALTHPDCAEAVNAVAAALPAGVICEGTSFWLEMTGKP